MITWLTDAEVDTLLAGPDTTTWTGRRDQLLLLMMVTTGMRGFEITSLNRADTCTDTHGAHVACRGKGRKERLTPLDTTTTATLRRWLTENPGGPSSPVFTARGTARKMSTGAVAQRITLHSTAAAAVHPHLAAKHVTPHVLRHTSAMRMLASGIDATTIALWLGHESLASTTPYLHADLELKQRALDRTAPPNTRPGRYKPPDKLLTLPRSPL